jgi:hypothetical protein
MLPKGDKAFINREIAGGGHPLTRAGTGPARISQNMSELAAY